MMYAGNMVPDPKRVFVAAPLHGMALTWSDALLTTVIEPAIEPLGCSVIRADRINRSGPILFQIINLLVHADLVVADVTGHNPNVLWEMGVRHTVGRPIVQIARVGEDLPFNIATMRTVFVDIGSAASITRSVSDLRSAAESALRHPAITPISERFRFSLTSDKQLALSEDHDAVPAQPAVTGVDGPRETLVERHARHFINITPTALVPLTALPEAAMEVLFLLLERLASGSTIGSPLDVPGDPTVLQITTPPCLVDGVRIPPLSVQYTLTSDQLLVCQIDVQP